MTKQFHTTCWTQVFEARGDSVESREALMQLCERYYQPVTAYLQRAERLSEDEASDISHEFFAELLAGEKLNHLERDKGKFRSYLLGALKHFLSRGRSHSRAKKRGGGITPTTIDAPGSDTSSPADKQTLPPDLWFDQQWAITILDRALHQVETECRQNGQELLFTTLHPWLTGEADYGDQIELAKKAGIAPNTLKSSIHRLRKRFRDAVKSEVAETLGDLGNVEDEMNALFSALRGQ